MVECMEQVFSLLFFLLLVVNLASLVIFGVDKWQSKRGGWRVSEVRLLLVGFFGPFGAFLGMLVFRHKICKAKFLLVPVFMVLQVLFIAYILFPRIVVGWV